MPVNLYIAVFDTFSSETIVFLFMPRPVSVLMHLASLTTSYHFGRVWFGSLP